MARARGTVRKKEEKQELPRQRFRSTVYTDPDGLEAVSVEQQVALGQQIEALFLEQEALAPVVAEQLAGDPRGPTAEITRNGELTQELDRLRAQFAKGEEFFGKVATVVEESQGDLTPERLGSFIAGEENTSRTKGNSIATGLLGAEDCSKAICKFFDEFEGAADTAALLETVVEIGVAVFGGGSLFDDLSRAAVTKTASRITTGETSATASGKAVHRRLAEERRASGSFDVVNGPIRDKMGNPIRVEKRVNLKTGEPQANSGLQTANPDAARFQPSLILDDKPLGRPIAKDRQEIIRFLRAFEQREGSLPETIAIQRYDPRTGVPVHTELYKPSDFLPRKKP